MLASTAQARSAESLSLDVTFSATGTIAVTLPDGTPVGSTSGPPTVIPAGFYTLQLSGPGGCTDLPYFHLQGPGNDLLDNMDDGEVAGVVDTADLLPNSTYTWSDENANPAAVYTFVTSADVLGTPPAGFNSPTGISSAEHSTAASQNDVVGSSIAAPSRGTLSGAVSAAGTVTLAYGGKGAARLAPGRYTITVTDRSTRSGFMLEAAQHPPISLTGNAFVGRRSVSVDLTAGEWYFAPSIGGRKTSFTVAA
jgi:hypothetical protein